MPFLPLVERNKLIADLQEAKSLVGQVLRLPRWTSWSSNPQVGGEGFESVEGWYLISEEKDTASPQKLRAAFDLLNEVGSKIGQVSPNPGNADDLEFTEQSLSGATSAMAAAAAMVNSLISMELIRDVQGSGGSRTFAYDFWGKDLLQDNYQFDQGWITALVAFLNSVTSFFSWAQTLISAMDAGAIPIHLDFFVLIDGAQQKLAGSIDRMDLAISILWGGIQKQEPEPGESDCEDLIEALKKISETADYSELIKLLEEIKEMLDPDLAGQIRIEGCEPPDDQNSSLLENWITGILGAVIARVVTATIPGPIDDLLLAPLIAALSDAIAAEVIALFKDIFGERYAEERIYAWSGRGLVGLSAQINALADQTAYLQEQLCQEISEAVAEQSGSQRCEPVLVVASSIREDLKLTSQLQIRWIPEGAVYDAKTPTRLLHLPNPRPDLDWCRDFEELRWRAGAGIVARVKWSTDIGTWGYFQDSEAAQEFFAAIVPLSASEPKGPWPRLTINHAGRPIKQRTWQPLRAVVALFDNDGQQIGLRCYQRPRQGC